MPEKKTVVLGVTGSIAAYKAVEIASRLKKQGISVFAVLTKSAKEFVSPLTFESITNNPVSIDLFERDSTWEIEHISLAKRADVFLVAPASANFIGKYAAGIADDFLTTAAMASLAPLLIAPAMNTNMYNSAANISNMELLTKRGVRFIEPESGMLACGDEGIGRLASVDAIIDTVLSLLYPIRDFQGKRILVSAGPTREQIDPVRYISNRSSGKMGYAIATAAVERGATVTLVSGPVQLAPVTGATMVYVESASEMYDAMLQEFDRCDIAVKAAAPADFTPSVVSGSKIKKNSAHALELHLVKTRDILGAMGERKGDRFLCGFAAETNDIEAYAKDKLVRKNLDMIAANDVTTAGAGFDSDTNILTFYFKDGEKQSLPIQSKRVCADRLLDAIHKRLK